MHRAATKQEAKVFWTGRSQAVRLPKDFRFDTETVFVHRSGSAVILEPRDAWPDGYVASFSGAPKDMTRPPQGALERRAKFG